MDLWPIDHIIVPQLLVTLGVIGVVPPPRLVRDALRRQWVQNDVCVCFKLSLDETESGNRSVGTEIDPRYTTSYSTSAKNKLLPVWSNQKLYE